MASEPWRGEPYDAVPVERPRYRPPVGIPTREAASTRARVLAITLHALVLLAIISPWAVPRVLDEIETGSGGPGPAGGGGGGRLGTGGRPDLGARERLHYIQVAPAPAPAAVAPTPPVPTPPVVPPPVVPPKPVPAPVPPPVAAPVPQPAAPAAAPAASDVGAAAPTPGTGGGTGNDGTAGSGPGSGGGVGSGIGTGRGSGVGPGTGGGNTDVYPPQATEVFIPPLPVPGKVRGTRLVAIFDVDSTGKVVSFDFTQTGDGGYNRKLKEVLSGFRFRPGTRADGTPVRAKGQIVYDL